MRNLSLILLVLLAFGCGTSDITDDLQIDLIDAADPPDADPNAPDADPAAPDANPNPPDANPNPPDASNVDATVSPDAADDRAQIFCDRYDSLCGYDDQSMQRFDDEGTCLAAFASFSDTRQTCVEDELDLLEGDSDLSHCRSAMGRPPCN